MVLTTVMISVEFEVGVNVTNGHAVRECFRSVNVIEQLRFGQVAALLGSGISGRGTCSMS